MLDDLLTRDNTVWCHSKAFPILIDANNPPVGECLLEEGIGKEWDLFAFENFEKSKEIFEKDKIQYLPFYYGLMC